MADRLGLTIVNVLDPVLGMLQEEIGETAAARPGRQYVLDADYFRRIDAMHFVLAHDDGQAQAGIAEADVILVGVSRSSKTPTSFYLANRGVKAANVPLVPGSPDPPGLAEPRCPVIGLTLDPAALIEIRRHRLAHDRAWRPAAAGHHGLHRPGHGEGRAALGAADLQPPRLAGDRRDPALDRGDGGHRVAADGSLAQPPASRRDPAVMAPGAPPLVLASGSATRQALLAAAGLTFSVQPTAVGEAAIKRAMQDADAADVAMALAHAKAECIVDPTAFVIGADQMLVCGG